MTSSLATSRVQICAYLRAQSGGVDVPGYAFQNFWAGETKTVLGIAYTYAPIRISDTAGARGGERSEGELSASLNQLMLNFLLTAKRLRYLILVDVRLVDVPTNNPNVRLLAQQRWRISKVSRAKGIIRAPLRSPLDAVRASAPRFRLTTANVGQVPDTGQMFLP